MAMFETLGAALRAGDRLTLRCLACGREASWPRERALSAFGPFAPPWEVRSRVRCSGCGETRRVRVTV